MTEQEQNAQDWRELAGTWMRLADSWRRIALTSIALNLAGIGSVLILGCGDGAVPLPSDSDSVVLPGESETDSGTDSGTEIAPAPYELLEIIPQGSEKLGAILVAEGLTPEVVLETANAARIALKVEVVDVYCSREAFQGNNLEEFQLRVRHFAPPNPEVDRCYLAGSSEAGTIMFPSTQPGYIYLLKCRFGADSAFPSPR